MSMLREAPGPDGKKGPVSLRRVLALGFSVSAVGLFTQAVGWANTGWGWYAYIPGSLCLVAVLALTFFTTWADIAAIVSAWKGKP